MSFIVWYVPNDDLTLPECEREFDTEQQARHFAGSLDGLTFAGPTLYNEQGQEVSP